MLNRIEMYESQTSRLAKYLDDGATKKTENGGRVTPCYLCTVRGRCERCRKIAFFVQNKKVPKKGAENEQ